MKKLFLFTALLIPMICIASEIDSTFISVGQSFGLSGYVLTFFGIIATWFVGQKIPLKWTSLSLWIEKILYGLYIVFHKLNEKTNNEGKKTGKVVPPPPH